MRKLSWCAPIIVIITESRTQSVHVHNLFQEVFEKTWATKASLRKNTLIIKRTPKVTQPPSASPVATRSETPIASSSKSMSVVVEISVPPAKPSPTTPTQGLELPISREEARDLPSEQLVQLFESRMKIWEGPGSEGWMLNPRVSN